MKAGHPPDTGSPHEKARSIIVNGRPKEVTQKELSFAEIVALAFAQPPAGANTLFTVTYRRAQGNKPEGSLIAGESVRVKEGMIINVTATDKS